MHAPFFSIVSLITELFVTASVFYIIYRAYHEGVFMRGFAYCVLGYEAIFNITYMFSRVIRHVPEHASAQHSPFHIGLAIFHGIFSLVMFIALIVFFLMAARAYGNGVDYFKLHPWVTTTFVIAWTISIFSGVLFFFVLYI